ncbi:MAG: NAD(P)(+) transhydrogenase (Re/Si-specific) subunit alpha, partial [Cyclobacteriaceae bacterium]|nr:NAD(P)(+) transhydrogenase (Re/Si-specific) subunit alpha [Cyclobacteriaceae bacterium]
MIIGIMKEPQDEARVALLPEAVKTLLSWKVSVWVENDAGSKAYASDHLYQDAGAEIHSRTEVLSKADLILGIQPISETEISQMKPDAVLMGQLNALFNPKLTEFLINNNRTAFSMELVPR